MHNQVNDITMYEAILSRRSIRDYTSQKVDAKRIKSLLEAAIMAPTALNLAPWAFVVVQDVSVLQSLSEATKSYLMSAKSGLNKPHHTSHDPACNIFFNASTLIIICANKKHPTAFADCWMAAENLMLSALAMDLGSCVVGDALIGLNQTQHKLSLGIADDFEAIAPIVVGFPNAEVDKKHRKRPYILSWIESQHHES